MYSQQMNEIMSSIEFFNGIYGKSMSNGINFTTNNFKENFSIEDFTTYYKTKNPQAYAYYQNIVEKAYNFKDALQEYVNQDDFLDNWNNLSKKEKSYIIYFDSDSYITLRAKLPSEEIMPINWDDIIKSAHFQWDEKTMKAFDMPEELYNPPINKLQALKQRRALLAIGYTEDSVNKISPVSGIDAMTHNLFEIILEKIPKMQLPDMMEKIGIRYAGHHFYNMSFIQEEEKKLQNRSKLKM